MHTSYYFSMVNGEVYQGNWKGKGSEHQKSLRRKSKKEGETVNCEWNKDYFWVGKGKCDSYPDESVRFAIII